MFKRFLVLGGGVLIFSLSSFSNISPVSAGDSCYISEEKMAEMLALPFDQYETYDESIDVGWRGLLAKGCFAEAAGYIHSYLDLHKADLDKPDLLIQTFHEGMMLSNSGEDDKAVGLFRTLLFPENELGKTWNLNGRDWNATEWNSYVSGTVAFFDKDRAGLDGALAELTASQAKIAGDKPRPSYSPIFVSILSRLGNCWQASFKDAYSNSCNG